MGFQLEQNIKVAVDAVCFGYDTTGIYLLLIERKHGNKGINWAVPGGFVEDNEELDFAAIRELKEETGITVKQMKQFYTFAGVKRDTRGRIISIAHYILMNKKGTNPKGADDAKTAQWVAIRDIPQLAFDHNEMVEIAYRNLQKSISSLQIDCMNETPTLEDVKLLGKLLNKEIKSY